MRGRGASQSLRRADPGQDSLKPQEGENQLLNEDAVWRKWKEDLIRIAESLESGSSNAESATKIREVAARVPHAKRNKETAQGLGERLDRIEALLQTQTPSPASSSQGSTWARVAAMGMRGAGNSPPPQLARPTVRVRMPQAKGMEPGEVLKEIKKTIPGAVAVRMLHSGDIDVTLPDEASRDKAQGIPPTEAFKVYRKDYLVEVGGVPLSLRVACEKGANNTQLAASICEASKTIAPGLQITTIRWLHAQKEPAGSQREASGKPAKTRGSLIVGFQTQEMQRQAVRGGLVINAQLFEVRLFERELQIVQCFNCQQWGHTQNACGKRTRCGQCAGDHSTRECLKERVSCINCGKQHRAWERHACPTFQAYYERIQARRANLYARTSSIRSAYDSQASSLRSTPHSSQFGESWSTVSRKRGRAISPAQDDTQRRVGRPTYLEQAGRDPAQQRLEFSQGAASASQENSTGGINSVEANMTQDE
jgi:hypothetical protein